MSGPDKPGPMPAPGTRNATQIRDDIVLQRAALSASVDALRQRWSEATDISLQVSRHKGEVALVGLAAAATAAAVGVAVSHRRRR